MLLAFQVLTILVVAVAMALALAHALELPGKLRLSKEQYLTVQPIYYPGFTIGGAAEPLGILLLTVLLALTPAGNSFWLIAASLLALVVMHAAYWLLTHPVNNFWLKDIKLDAAGSGFFGFDPLASNNRRGIPEWTQLRDRWEFSHVVRTAFGLISLVLLAVAIALD